LITLYHASHPATSTSNLYDGTRCVRHVGLRKMVQRFPEDEGGVRARVSAIRRFTPSPSVASLQVLLLLVAISPLLKTTVFHPSVPGCYIDVNM